MKPNKIKRHLYSKHPQHVGKNLSLFGLKRRKFDSQSYFERRNKALVDASDIKRVRNYFNFFFNFLVLKIDGICHYFKKAKKSASLGTAGLENQPTQNGNSISSNCIYKILFLLLQRLFFCCRTIISLFILGAVLRKWNSLIFV